MSVNVGTAVAYLTLDAFSFENGLRNARTSLQSFADSSNSVSSRISALGSSFQSLGKSMTTNLTVPITAAGVGMIKAATDFESAFAGVQKTVDATEEQYEQLSDAIKKMATETASSSVEIAGVMEVAGQLGVEVGEAGENITKFTKVMVMLGDSTNLSAEQAATALARFMNIMGTSNEDVDRLGATIVDLGNNFATTEAEIVEMSTRLASGAKMAGFTEAEVLALATAMSSVGIQAEAGGTAMVQTLNEIEKAVSLAATGEEVAIQKLEAFARVAGMSGKEFAKTWKNEPMKALEAFIKGINTLDQQGESAVMLLDELELSGIRQSNMLRALALACDVMSDSVNVANTAWDENVALTTEAEKRYGTTASQLSQLKESFKNLAIEFGEIMLPYLQKIVDSLRQVIEWFSKLDEKTKENILTVLAVVAALGPLLTIIGKIISIIGNLMSVLSSLGTVFTAIRTIGGVLLTGIQTVATFITGTLIPAIGSISAPVLAVIAIIGAVIAIGVLLIKNWEEVCAWAKKLGETITESVGKALEAVGDFFAKLGEKISEIAANIEAWLNELIDNVVSFFNKLVQDVTAWFAKIGSILSSFLESLFAFLSKLGDFFTNALKTIGEAFMNVLNVVKEAVGKILETLVNWGTELISTAVEIGKNFVSKFAEAFSNLVSSVTNFTTAFVTMISNWGASLFAKAQEIGTGFVSAITGSLQKVGSFFADIFTDIIDSISSIGPIIFEKGKNIITNLWDGMKSVFSSLVDWITDSISSLFDPISSLISSITSPIKSLYNKASSLLSGSHANGLDYVPYNGYVAELHEGERVLTKAENREYNKGEGKGSGDTYIFQSPEPIDEYQAVRLFKETKKEMDLDV